MFPLLRKGGSAVGREVLTSALNVFNDVVDGDKSIENALLERGGESLNNLKRKAVAKMRGEGAKRAALNLSSQSISRPRKNQTTKKRTVASKGKKQPAKKKAKSKKVKAKKTTTRTKEDINLHQFF